MDLLRLLDADQAKPKRIAVIGDAMEDVWNIGTFAEALGQEGCPKFKITSRRRTPGGAANAARQLLHWPSKTFLLAPIHIDKINSAPAWFDLEDEYFLPAMQMPLRSRAITLATGQIHWRSDWDMDYGCDDNMMAESYRLLLLAIENDYWDAVLISDYDKGFLQDEQVGKIIAICNRRGIPVVCDAKRPLPVYANSIVTCNLAYWKTHGSNRVTPLEAIVTTRGSLPPLVSQANGNLLPDSPPVPCRNHIGAGDCFAAHLTLALANGCRLRDAAEFAHAAGRAYVQHLFARPPWPHEVRRSLDLASGKRLDAAQVADLRSANEGRHVIFTNGVFRMLTAAHVEFLRWAKQQTCGASDPLLVVGINDDASARRARPGQHIRPLAERVAMLTALDMVDWVVVFHDSTPFGIIEELQPNVLVKGHEYEGHPIPGSTVVRDIRFSPQMPYTDHVTDIVRSIKRNDEQ